MGFPWNVNVGMVENDRDNKGDKKLDAGLKRNIRIV